MKFSRVNSTTIALVFATAVFLIVGTYTDNSGFQFAGIILGVVTAITAFNQARSGVASGDGD